MAETSIEWFEIGKTRQFPKHLRIMGKGNDGTIYLSIDISNENHAMLLALDDRIYYATYEDHIYVPSTWLSETFPKCKEVCAAAENRLDEFLRERNNKVPRPPR